MYDEDPRFPNRKKKEREQPLFSDEFTDASQEDPNGENIEVEPLPVSGYRIIGSDSQSPDEMLADVEPIYPVIEDVVAQGQAPIAVSAVAQEQRPAAEAPAQRPSFREVWIARIRKFAESPTRVYAAAGVGLGILIGIVFATVAWLTSDPVGRYDLQSVTSSAVGLTGHLFVQWDKDKKLEYRLAVQPSDPSQQAGFALAVSDSPHPLSMGINLLDSQGFVLCSKEILLKYDARSAAALAVSAPESHAGKKDADQVASEQAAQEAAFAQSDKQEAAREQGKDIFQNQIGPDGQIAAINSQGDIPCSKGSYEKVTSWSFTPNFPSLAEQNEVLNRQKERQASIGRPSAAEIAARKKAAAKVTAKLLPFSTEGDDAIVDFDASRGVIQTRGRKTFYMGKTSGAGANSEWQDYPVSIHFRCDRNSDCVLMHPGAGALRVRMSR